MLRVIDRAFERPVVTITGIAEALGATYPAAANNVKPLLAVVVAEELAGSYPKMIVFPGVMEAMRVG